MQRTVCNVMVISLAVSLPRIVLAQTSYTISSPMTGSILDVDSTINDPVVVSGLYTNRLETNPKLKLWLDNDPEEGEWVLESWSTITEYTGVPGMEMEMGSWTADLYNPPLNPWTESEGEAPDYVEDHALEVTPTNGPAYHWLEYYAVAPVSE